MYDYIFFKLSFNSCPVIFCHFSKATFGISLFSTTHRVREKIENRFLCFALRSTMLIRSDRKWSREMVALTSVSVASLWSGRLSALCWKHVSGVAKSRPLPLLLWQLCQSTTAHCSCNAVLNWQGSPAHHIFPFEFWRMFLIQIHEIPIDYKLHVVRNYSILKNAQRKLM